MVTEREGTFKTRFWKKAPPQMQDKPTSLCTEISMLLKTLLCMLTECSRLGLLVARLVC